MLMKDVDRTWIHWLGLPENKEILKGFKNRKDKSIEEYARFILFLFDTLIDTPAYGVAGVNEMLNEQTHMFAATRDQAKRGKSSASAQANTLLYKISYFENEEAKPHYNRCKLNLSVTREELQQFLAASGE